jgi:hypothetical protein
MRPRWLAGVLLAAGLIALLWSWSGRARTPELRPPPYAAAPGQTAAAPAQAPPSAALPAPASAQPAVVAPVTTTAKAAPTDRAPTDEAAFMSQLRRAADSDPVRALALAREGERLFPHGAQAAERSAILVKSLARQGRLSEARGEAEKMVGLYHGTPWALEVERETGAHPRIDH